MSILSRRNAAVVFLAFAFAYFFSALIRAITATLSPTLTQEFALSARDLGLLAGGYFIGFSAVQLPLGRWLDRHGPKKVILVFLSVAVTGCVAFSLATSFTSLLIARVLCGVGVGACLMAPLTGYRRWFEPALQMRANSWMLMTGSFGMVASTLPVQWLMPLVGWRVLFVALAAFVLLSMVVIYWQVPRWQQTEADPVVTAGSASYAEVWRHPYFRKMAFIGFVNYGGLIALQTLWATPWMIRMAGYSPVQAATGLFWINMAMLGTFWIWGWINPKLTHRGLKPEWIIARGQPISFVMLLLVIGTVQTWPEGAALLLALFCVSSTFVSLAQPAVGMAFPAALAGRALSAYNLVIFSGVFAMQWGIGLLIDGFAALGWTPTGAFQSAFGVFFLLCVMAYAQFMGAKGHNQTRTP